MVNLCLNARPKGSRVGQPTLNELKGFIAVAEHKSFRSAAARLGIGASSLSHLIRSLERGLGVRLIHRTTRSVSLTEAGASLLQRLGPAVRDLQDALRSVDDFTAGPRGTLRINAPELGARMLMTQAIPKFLERHPDCSVDLFVEGGKVDIVADKFDLGVRLGYAVPQDMIAVPFDGEARFMCFAAPAYVERCGVPSHPDDLLKHRCVQIRFPSGAHFSWKFERGAEKIVLDDVPGSLVLNHMFMLVDAAVAGMGIIYTLEQAARPAVETGLLVPLLKDWSQPIEGVTLYYPGHRLVPGCLRAFIDVVKEVFPRRAHTEASDRPASAANSAIVR